MSRRVALGHLGTESGTAKYGLRVSRPSNDACPSASTSAPVAVNELRFDSNNAIGNAPIYKIYDITVTAGSSVAAGPAGDAGTIISPGTYTNTSLYGETLTYVPIPFLFLIDGSTLKGDMWKVHDATYSGYITSVDQLGDNEGWEADVTKTGIKVYNYSTSQRTFRLFLLDPSVVS